ncbi:MAG TPA: gephyrin-like molybdotransferase Glp [Solirubrobacteraceae bacterium]
MSDPLLSIDGARALILAEARPRTPVALAFEAALGRVLAQDVTAAADVPRFAGSAMDGFAIRSGAAGRRLRLVGESRAGAPFGGEVGDGEAVRISTGAALPAGADAVLQQELVEEDGAQIVLRDAVDPGRNVRAPGEDLRAGEIVLQRGRRLGPADLGVAVHAGLAALQCAPQPRLAVLATGDELRPPGAALEPGQIHNSNLVTLAALAEREGCAVALAQQVPDDPAATRAAIAQAIAAADVVILSGGVSVGPHDHVKPALEALGVQERFWRVALRPGKPTWFGVTGDTLVFGLPGNPVSAMVTFLLFARPAIAAIEGVVDAAVPGHVRLGEPLPRDPRRDECARVRIADGLAYATGPQGSHVLSSMALADGLAVVPRGEGELPAGTEVELLEI